jgi:hypothetical protein
MVITNLPLNKDDFDPKLTKKNNKTGVSLQPLSTNVTHNMGPP